MRLCLWNEPPWQLPRDFCRVHGFFSPVGQALPAAAGQSEELMLASHEGCFCSWERPSCGDGITALPPTLQWVSSHSAIDLICDAQDFSFYLKLRGKSVSESEMALLYEERIIYWRCWNQHLWVWGTYTPFELLLQGRDVFGQGFFGFDEDSLLTAGPSCSPDLCLQDQDKGETQLCESALSTPLQPYLRIGLTNYFRKLCFRCQLL